MTKKTTPAKSGYVGTQPSNTPGGYLPSPHLERANTFGRMAYGLEAALIDRNALVGAVREAVADYEPQVSNHRRDLLEVAQAVEAGTRKPRDLEDAIYDKLEFFRRAESATLTEAPKHLDAMQIHAAQMAEKFRVSRDPHFWSKQ